MLFIQIEKKVQKKGLFNKALISGRFIFLKQSLIDKIFVIPACFIILSSDSNQFEFSYLSY